MVPPSKSSSILSINFFGSNDTNFDIVNLSVFYLILIYSLPSSLNFHIDVELTNAKWKFDEDG